jgi:hypothetical protein
MVLAHVRQHSKVVSLPFLVQFPTELMNLTQNTKTKQNQAINSAKELTYASKGA